MPSGTARGFLVKETTRIREILFANSRRVDLRPKDYDITLDEKGVENVILDILVLLNEEAEKWNDRISRPPTV